VTSPRCEPYQDALERLVEASLDETGRVRLLDHAGSCDDCRGQIEWIESATVDLEAIGDRIVAHIPEIDIVEAVLAEVSKQPAPNVISFDSAPRARTFGLAKWLGAAAAAAVVIAMVWFSTMVRDNVPPQEIAQVPPPSIEDTQPAVAIEPVAPTGPESGNEAQVIAEPVRPPVLTQVEPPDLVEPSDIDLSTLTRQAVLAGFLESLQNNNAIDRLMDWAQLEEEQAKAIVENEEASTEALIGAAPSLSEADAEAALLTAVARSPESPLPRFRLARLFSMDPARSGDALSQARALSGADPENALPFYQQASEFLSQDPPDIEAALEALEQGKILDTASAYGLEGALAREQALIESGTDPEMARLLSALTAGRWEAEELTSISNDLLAFGQSYAETGDLDTASAIFNSILELGQQIDEGADLTQEQLAGLDIQRAAIEALRSIGREADVFEAAVELTDSSQELLLYLNELTVELTELLIGPVSLEDLMRITGLILSSGDLNLLDYLPF